MESVAGLDVGVKHSSLCVVRRDDRSMKPVSRHRTVTTLQGVGRGWLGGRRPIGVVGA
jgi:hypothetical protein